MTGDINMFRKRFFGGFNRQDVVEYVGKLAQERNEQQAAKERAIADARASNEEILELRRNLEEERRLLQQEFEQKALVIEAAAVAYKEFENAFGDLSAQLEDAAARAHMELINVSNVVAKLPPAAAIAGDKLDALRADLYASNSEDAQPDVAYEVGPDNEYDL